MTSIASYIPSIYTIINGVSRSLLVGGGLCYAIETKKYLGIPISFLFPGIYAGYHTYKHRNAILRELKTPFQSPPVSAPLQ